MKASCGASTGGAGRHPGMGGNALVSIVIPTRNSAQTLGPCLEAIAAGTYRNVEVIVADCGSTDKTLEIAARFGAKIVTCVGKRTLGARSAGVEASRGQYILLLDSDQFLEKTSIERAVQCMNDYDMLIFEELSYEPKGVMEKLAAANKELVHKVGDVDPYTGEVIPRFFKSEILKKAYQAVPETLHTVWTHEDAIFYCEAWHVAGKPKIGFIPNAVYHRELRSLGQLIKKNYRYGKLAKAMVNMGYYQDLVSRRDRLSKKLRWALKYPRCGIMAFLFSLIVKTPYRLGFLSG